MHLFYSQYLADFLPFIISRNLKLTKYNITAIKFILILTIFSSGIQEGNDTFKCYSILYTAYQNV